MASNGDEPSSPVRNGSFEPSSPEVDRRESSMIDQPVVPTTTSTIGATSAAPAAAAGPPKHVEDVMYSDIGLNTLLNRLKQSIATARDFAAFLKKRSGLEEEQAAGLKRLARAHLETVRRAEVRSGSYAQQLADVLRVHESMSDNGMQFALSLHQMHEDLNELSNNIERGRKHWKHEGLDAERRSSEAEQLMQKAKGRYDSLAESLDRARTGDSKGGRRIGLKGPKSAEQYESDLVQKVSAADQEYQEKVQQAKSQRTHLTSTSRPAAVRALRELIQECDTGLTLQLQKYATFNEKLLLGNGLAISPLSEKESSVGAQRSLRDIIADINNDDDYNNYVGQHYAKIPRPSDIKYEKHPTLAPKQQTPSAPVSTFTAPLTVNTTQSQPGSMNTRQPTQPTPVTASSTYTPVSAAAASQFPSSGNVHPAFQQQSPPAYQQAPAPAQSNTFSQAPYPVHPAERNVSQPYAPNAAPVAPAAAAVPVAAPVPIAKTARPVFGVSLEDLFARDESPVPIIVYQCMQAVEMFGLDVEGIYRLSGTSRLVAELRDTFNTQPPNSPAVDFRNPANFYHDVNSVATLLKQFFRDLPDPLFPKHAYAQFIAAAKIDDEYARRDALHQLINDLPDPNYATLRALTLHLARVMHHEGRNRMGSSNLSICFAPSLMGAHTSTHISDAGLQARVLDNILNNATAIFDED